MDGTLLGVIVGGSIALLPSLVSAIVSIVNEWRKQRHELKMKRVEWECAAKIDAIRQYSESIGVCMATNSSDAYRDYMANFERLSLYVSDETYQAMLAINDPRDLDLDDRDLRALSALLRTEMLAASSHVPTRDHQQKRAGKAAQQLHHFFSQCWRAILPQPSNPANPVECNPDKAEDEGENRKHVPH